MAANSDRPPFSKFQRPNLKGFGDFRGDFKGKGKWSKGGKGEKGGKGAKGHEARKELQGLQLVWRTPDGRDLCFGFNAGHCSGKCNRVGGTPTPSMGVAPSAPVQLPNVKVLYLFAGKQRQADVGSCLRQMQAKGQIVLELLEFDIARSEDHDLRSDELWRQITDRLRLGN
ncbi:unnamed protein product, partial [Durusdinium trenchii]